MDLLVVIVGKFLAGAENNPVNYKGNGFLHIRVL